MLANRLLALLFLVRLSLKGNESYLSKRERRYMRVDLLFGIALCTLGPFNVLFSSFLSVGNSLLRRRGVRFLSSHPVSNPCIHPHIYGYLRKLREHLEALWTRERNRTCGGGAKKYGHQQMSTTHTRALPAAFFEFSPPFFGPMVPLSGCVGFDRE